MIPEHIKDFQFVRLQPKSKLPFDRDWARDPSARFTSDAIRPWIEQGNNYGVLTGPDSGIAVADCDNPWYINLFEERLPETFSVFSSRGGRHFYYKVENFPISEQRIPLVDPDCLEGMGRQGGDIRYGGSYVVGPGSIHPNTGLPYLVVNDVSVATVDFKFLLKVFGQHFGGLKQWNERLSQVLRTEK